jgi:cytoskeletal protein RodZ
VDALLQSRYLKSERLNRGLSLHDLAQKTKISISLIKALEAGRFSEIGPPPLVHSYLKVYSQALADHQIHSVKQEDPLPANTPHPPDLSHVEFTSTFPRKKRFLRMAAFLLIGVLVLGVLYQVGMISRKDQGLADGRLPDTSTSPESLVSSAPPHTAIAIHDANASMEEPSMHTQNQALPGGTSIGPLPDQGAETESLTTLSAKATDHDESAFIQPKNPFFHQFEIEAVQSSWVEVRCDGRRSEGVLLQAGEKREWQVTQELQILVGNAGGVRMKWDGSAVNLGGRPGQVLRFKLPHPDLTGESP